jgi:hypothetical protein
MSALWADTTNPEDDRRSPGRPEQDRVAGPGRPFLIEGGRNGRLARAPFLLALMLILGLGMAGLLALNTTLQGQAFEARTLSQQANRLTYQEAALQRQVEELRAADNLAARASQLGMRANPDPAFVRLSDGKRMGQTKPNPVNGNELPGLVVKTPEQIAAEKRAAEAKKKAAEAKRQAAEARRIADRNDPENRDNSNSANSNSANNDQGAGGDRSEDQQDNENGRG